MDRELLATRRQPSRSAIEGAPPVVLEDDGAVLLFGGCYSNLEATLALRAEARRLDIPAERTVCTGDVVAYCADAAATVDLIRDWGVRVVMGNCEEALGFRQQDCGCGFGEDTACHQLAADWYAYADSEVTEEQRTWMRSLPRRLDIHVTDHRLAVVHGSVDRINQLVFASTPLSEKRRQIARAACDGVVAGHCGIPFAQIIGRKLWLNAGAIGLPANDGTRRGWYALVVPRDDRIEIRIAPLAYNAAAAAAKMRSRGLPDGYAEALETGLWPSCDVLPAPERVRRGRPLPALSLRWRPTAALASHAIAH